MAKTTKNTIKPFNLSKGYDKGPSDRAGVVRWTKKVGNHGFRKSVKTSHVSSYILGIIHLLVSFLIHSDLSLLYHLVSFLSFLLSSLLFSTLYFLPFISIMPLLSLDADTPFTLLSSVFHFGPCYGALHYVLLTSAQRFVAIFYVLFCLITCLWLCRKQHCYSCVQYMLRHNSAHVHSSRKK